MKTLLTFIFLLTASISWTQELELDFAHRYGIIENDLRHSVNFVEYFDEFETWVVAGNFESEIDVGINSTAVLTSENEMRLGFVAMYDNDFEIINYFKMDGGIISAALDEDNVILSGVYSNSVDFDLQNDDNEIFESSSNFGNGFIASYSHQGGLNWVNTFQSDIGGNRGVFCSIYQDKIFLVNYYDGSQFGGTFNFEQDEINFELTSNNGSSTVLFGFDLDGNYIFHNHFSSDNGRAQPWDFFRIENKLYLSFRILNGNFDAGINEVLNFNYEFDQNVLVCAYELNSLDLVEYYSLKAADENSGIFSAFISKEESTNQILISSPSVLGTILAETHLNSETQNLEFLQDNSAISYKIDQDTGVMNSGYLSSDGTVSIQECLLLQNGDFVLSVSYSNNIYFNENLLDEGENELDFHYALIYFNSELNGAELFKFAGQERLFHDILNNPNDGELFVSGSYEGNYDMDFSEEFAGLGQVFDDQAGFLAKYNFDPITNVNDKDLVRIVVFPNPSDNKLFVDIHHTKPITYKIYNVKGELVKSEIFENKVIDISLFPNGFYSLIIGEISQKFIINRAE